MTLRRQRQKERLSVFAVRVVFERLPADVVRLDAEPGLPLATTSTISGVRSRG
jgi:hypothetical protein